MADTKAQEVEMEDKVPVKFEEPIQETNENKSKKSKKKGKDGKDDKTKQAKPANIFQLFMYANWFDFIMMLVGFVSAVILGCGLPISLWVFGLITNTLINLQITQNLLLVVGNQTFNAFNSTMGSDMVTFISLNNTLQNCTAYQPIFEAHYSPSAECLAIDEFQDMIMANSSFQNFTITINVLFTDAMCSTFEQLFVSLMFPFQRCIGNDAFVAEVNRLVIFFAIIAVVVFIFGTIQVLTYQTSSERQTYKMRLAYYRAVLRQNIAWFDENASGAIASRLSDDLDKVQTGIGDKLAAFFQWITTFIAGLVIGFAIDYRLTLVILAVTPFIVVAAFIMGKVLTLLTSEEQKQYASAGAVAEEVLSSVRTVIAFGGEYREASRYDSQLSSARNTGSKKGLAVGSSLASVYVLMFISYAIAFWFGAWLISVNLAEAGNILTVFFSLLIGAFSLGQAGPNLEAFNSALGSAGTIISTIKRIPPIDSASDEGIVPETKTATIEFKDVNHTYPARPDVQVLKNVSFKVEVGKVVALVGHSGCGKSTVIQLLQRFYDADSGEVLVGGHPVSSLNLKYLRSIIGVVSQEPVLFNMSIADNIRFGRDGGEGVSMEEIQQAARAANVHDFIAGLPNGYNTFVGDRGAQLSGGQKQRVAIARALIREPNILLLDEATSALDSESEALVQAALEKAQLGRTTLVIAHRLSTIQNADCIVCMDKGEIVEVGNHAELMKMEGLYYDMVTAQSQGGMEEAFIGLELDRETSPIKSPSSHQIKRDFSKQFSQQTSVTVEASETTVAIKTDKEKQDEWDKELKSVSMFRLLALNAKEWWLIILGLLGAGVNGSIFPIFAIVFAEVLDVFTRPPDQIIAAVHLPAGMFLVIGAVSGAAIFLKMVCFSVSGEYLTARIRSRLFRAILRQEMGWFDDERNTTGSLTTRLAEDAAHVQGATGSRLGTLIETVFGLLISLVIAFVYSWLMSLVIIGFVPIFALASIAEYATIHAHTLRSKKAMLEAGKLSLDSIENIRTVTALNLQNTFSNMYRTELLKPHRTSMLQGIFEGFAYGFSQSIIFIGYIIAFRFGAFLVALPPDHLLYEPFSDIFRVLFALIFGAMAAGQASAFAPDYTKAKLSANRIFAMLDREPVIDNYSEDGQKLENLDGSVNLNDITFSYPSRPDVRVLSDISLSVKPGQTLALVGPSGCGKSTIVSLMERFYDPGLGNVAVDGSDIISLNLRWLRSQIGIVSQEPILFDSSIADNIRYGANHRTVSDEEVIEAAKAANIHSFIQTLPEGYNTNAGEKGTQLSGGQKQRIAIARALIRNPRILLLDEATSALDTESERIVQEALDRAREGRTSIVIAHRLSTIYGADCIAVITQGKLVEMGTHAELLAKGGLYYKLNQKQQLAGGKK